ncbi:hypothetical protein V6N13_013143 [Hibiscus sabdariffa]
MPYHPEHSLGLPVNVIRARWTGPEDCNLSIPYLMKTNAYTIPYDIHIGFQRDRHIEQHWIVHGANSKAIGIRCVTFSHRLYTSATFFTPSKLGHFSKRFPSSV